MKIAFITRATLFSAPGGDTTQVEQTALHLEHLGVHVDIKLTSEPINYEAYDLLHFFNIIRPADILYHVTASQTPFVISTIYVDYSEYEKCKRQGIIGWLTKILSPDSTEYLKTIARSLINGEKIRSKSYLWSGHYQSVRYLIQKAKLLLPNSLSEYHRLIEHYKVSNAYAVIPNAIDPSWLSSPLHIVDEYRGAVICAASIEGRKNQLNLIRALQGTNIKLFIIGKASPNHRKYYDQCRAEAGPNVKFIDRVAGQELYNIYHSAKVHVLPSFFETTGLSTLEAALMGCNVVITAKGDTVEYFGNDAFYCDPENPSSIKEAVLNALASPFNESLKERILNNFTWEITAAKTLAAYNMALQ